MKGPKRPKGHIQSGGSRSRRNLSKREKKGKPKPQFMTAINDKTGEKKRVKFVPDNSVAAHLEVQEEVRRKGEMMDALMNPKKKEPNQDDR